MIAAIDDPLASASGQFPLAAPADTPPSDDTPSPVDRRPWGLRNLTVAAPSRDATVPGRYDHDQQVTVDATGTPLITMGDPTAIPTETVDGQDGPSSTDWINDFCPDEPYQP